jgi:hypothetical protein
MLMNSYHRYKALGRPIGYLIECWVHSWSPHPAERAGYQWACSEPVDDARDDPERAWYFILYAPDDPRCAEHFGVLAAGPLEDLLSFHGAAFIDRVEALAHQNPKFAFLLGGVWQFQMSDEIWARVQLAWDRRGWDGIPAEA